MPEMYLMSTTDLRCAMSLSKMTAIDLPSRTPPPKKAMLSACVRSRVCTLRKAPSRKYSYIRMLVFKARLVLEPKGQRWLSWFLRKGLPCHLCIAQERPLMPINVVTGRSS